MTPGTPLAARRGERGVTIQQAAAAIRIRGDHHLLLKPDELGSFPAPVYARGYLKTYASHLGLDPDSLVTSAHIQERPPRLALGLGGTGRKPRMVVTAPAVGAAQFADSRNTLQAGSVVYFTGVDVQITSGKAAATLITIDGRSLGALGVGVATREFSSQTSPQS
ncbi:MAG TPA: helix-turn-helix transcriptional regulator [Candidatus Dormibacteraeota bacterium]|nr:helix-turn-helix transcriptional regulator [Candidatus Dormibacteraeota bacterium]